MIRTGEIQKIANNQNVLDTQIEKDYIIGWILKGVSINEYLFNHLVFKGGTVLKKVWFDDYRFSEDMDFSFLGEEWNISTLKSALESLCEWVYKESRITLNLTQEESTNTQYRCYISYQGPLGGTKDIKCDISKDEKIYFPIETKEVLDNYSDAENIFKINVYSLEESLAEKLRCTIQRTIPRDIYDVWYLIEEEGIDIENVAFGYKDKTEYKAYDPLSILDVLKSKEKKYKANWEKNLQHQIRELPNFERVWREFIRSVRKLEELLKS